MCCSNKVPELAAEVDVMDVSVEMDTDSNPVPVPAGASSLLTMHLLDSASDDDDDDDDDNDDDNDAAADANDNSPVHWVYSSDSDHGHEFSGEVVISDDDRGSSVDVRESPSNGPSSPATDTLPAVVQTADGVAEAGNLPIVPAEAGGENLPVSVATAPANTLAQAVPELDDSLSCFKTTKWKKTVASPPLASKDDDTDEAEVSVCFFVNSIVK